VDGNLIDEAFAYMSLYKRKIQEVSLLLPRLLYLLLLLLLLLLACI
jgi:hypothetical protein